MEHVRYGKFKCVDNVAILIVEWPANRLVQCLYGDEGLFGDMAHDGMRQLALVVSLLALDNVLGRHAALREVDVALFLVDTEYDGHLIAPYPDELLDTADASPGQLREQNHAINVVILEQFNVGTHLSDLADEAALDGSQV